MAIAERLAMAISPMRDAYSHSTVVWGIEPLVRTTHTLVEPATPRWASLRYLRMDLQAFLGCAYRTTRIVIGAAFLKNELCDLRAIRSCCVRPIEITDCPLVRDGLISRVG
jgi:hypothetical protein